MSNKLTTDYFYDSFINDQHHQMMVEVRRLSEYRKSQKYILERLEPYEYTIRQSGINYKEFTKNTSKKVLKKIDDMFFSITIQKKINKEDLVRLVRSLLAVNKLITRSSDRVTLLKSNIIPEKVFKQVLRAFNQGIVDAILKTGYEYTFGSSVGSLVVRGLPRGDKKVVDWGKSYVKKKEILANGSIPFKAVYDDKLNKIGDNGGIPWLVYFTNQLEYWWYWCKRGSNTENMTFYGFTPTFTNIKLLNEHKKDPVFTMNYRVKDDIQERIL